MSLGDAFHYHRTISPEERERYEREGREVAAEHPDGGMVFTDGLGALGVGSWSDGPASIRQAAYQRALVERTQTALDVGA